LLKKARSWPSSIAGLLRQNEEEKKMFDIEMMILSFAGGVFGAAIGGLPAFVLCGVLATIGLAVFWATGEDTFVNALAWGPLFGPHIAFAGGVAAAAYAAKKGKLETGRDIVSPLMGLDAPDVLAVGGVFGALGYVLFWVSGLLGNIGTFPWMNGAVFSICVSSIIVRLGFGQRGLLGQVRTGDKRWVASDTASWLPWQSQPAMLVLIAVGIGLPIAYFIRIMPELFTFGFAIAAVSLVFLGAGFKFPVTHHIGIASGMGVIATGNIWWGLTFALLGAFMGEVFACSLLNHGDTHIDPPCWAVSVTWLLTALLSASALKNLSGAIPIVIAAAVALVGFGVMTALRNRPAVGAEETGSIAAAGGTR
jgi:hypothetical protein